MSDDKIDYYCCDGWTVSQANYDDYRDDRSLDSLGLRTCRLFAVVVVDGENDDRDYDADDDNYYC